MKIVRISDFEHDGLMYPIKMHNHICSLDDNEKVLILSGVGGSEIENIIIKSISDADNDDIDFMICECGETKWLKDIGLIDLTNKPIRAASNLMIKVSLFKYLDGFMSYDVIDAENSACDLWSAKSLLGILLSIKKAYYKSGLAYTTEANNISDIVLSAVNETVDNLFMEYETDAYPYGIIEKCMLYLRDLDFIYSNSLFCKTSIVTNECVNSINYNNDTKYFSQQERKFADFIVSNNSIVNSQASRVEAKLMGIDVISNPKPDNGNSNLFRPTFYVPKQDNINSDFIIKAFSIAVFLGSRNIEIHARYEDINEHIFKLIHIMRSHNATVNTFLYSV